MYALTDAGQEYARIVSRALAQAGLDGAGAHTIIDLCAGSGGPLPFVQRELHRQGLHTRLVLTDLVPNHAAYRRIKAENERLLGATCCTIDYLADPVNAADCREKGTRTLFGAFHHFPTALARQILQNAVDTRSVIIVVDSQRSPFNVLVTPWLTALIVLLFSAFIRSSSIPRYLLRQALTYLVPVLPAMMLWDSIASFLRMYSPKEVRAIIESLEGAESFTWLIDYEPGKLGTQYCIGIPR
jgi:hypothetical protein